MSTINLKFRDWAFEVDKKLTEQTYKNVNVSGAESFSCNDCKNYVAYRDKVFTEEVKQLFHEFGNRLQKRG